MNPYTILQDTEMFDNDKPMAKIIGNNIRTIRLEKRLTQEYVAEHSGIHYKYLQEVEAGRKTPGMAVVQKISAALGVPLCRIVSVNGCPCSDAGLIEDVAKLFKGKEAKDGAAAVAIQGDGKIVAAGFSTVAGHFNSYGFLVTDFGLARYLP